jgi:hypothetical protein
MHLKSARCRRSAYELRQIPHYLWQTKSTEPRQISQCLCKALFLLRYKSASHRKVCGDEKFKAWSFREFFVESLWPRSNPAGQDRRQRFSNRNDSTVAGGDLKLLLVPPLQLTARDRATRLSSLQHRVDIFVKRAEQYFANHWRREKCLSKRLIRQQGIRQLHNCLAAEC